MKVQFPSQKYVNVVLICFFILLFLYGLYRQNSDFRTVQQICSPLDTTQQLSPEIESICVNEKDTLKGHRLLIKSAHKIGGHMPEDSR